jgi:hypothetical protein
VAAHLKQQLQAQAGESTLKEPNAQTPFSIEVLTAQYFCIVL